MKIYIENMPLKKVKDKLKVLDKYYKDHNSVIEVLSESGVFIVDNHNIFKINYHDDKLSKVENYLNKFDLWIETVNETKEKVFNLPLNHVSSQIVIIEFKIINTSSVTMIIEGSFSLDETSHEKELAKTKDLNDEKQFYKKRMEYENYKVDNFYFKVDDNNYPLKNKVKDELNVFLSLLN